MGACIMGQKTVKVRKSYSQEFKIQAIELAKELGSKKAAEKLGIVCQEIIGGNMLI